MSVHELAKRAVVMDEYLAVGELPYHSPITSPAIEGPHRSNPVRVSVHSVLGSLSDRARFEPKRSRQVGFAALPSPKQEENAAREETPPNVRAFRNRRKWALFVVFICVAAIGLTAAVLFARPKKSAVSVAACNDEAMTGATCQLSEFANISSYMGLTNSTRRDMYLYIDSSGPVRASSTKLTRSATIHKRVLQHEHYRSDPSINSMGPTRAADGKLCYPSPTGRRRSSS
ncbi:hypothetical protein FRC19_010941 [Serendipita sp. 401]|nr:hypothetical protein FRC19_010941 [Serendipita sp. 401]